MCGRGVSRRLVLNGVTAEVPCGAISVDDPDGGGDGDWSPDSGEFYHELELVRLARRPATPPPRASPAAAAPPPRRCRTPAASAPPSHPRLAHVTRATYLGWCAAQDTPRDTAPTDAEIDTMLERICESGREEPVVVVVTLAGVKVTRPAHQGVLLWLALRRISVSWRRPARALVALLAREPAPPPAPPTPPTEPSPPTEERVPGHHYCHAFRTDTPDQAAELSLAVGDAFRMAFASQLRAPAPNNPLWTKCAGSVVGGGGAMGPRPPDSLPSLRHHYPPQNTSGACSGSASNSPSSSEESVSPAEGGAYRRLGGGGGAGGTGAPLMRRLALGFSGALLLPSDDDATPLVADTPTTPTNTNNPLCLNGGYINEASDAESRSRSTRASNREPVSGGNSPPSSGPVPTCPPLPTLPVHHSIPTVPVLPAPRKQTQDTQDNDLDFRKCNNFKNCNSGACSRTTSSSSGGSSCGAAHCNNNVPRPPTATPDRREPELKQAPWFQHGIPREIALEVLSGAPVGSFLVRGSTTQPSCFALSVRVPPRFAPRGIAHYLILTTHKGYKIKGFTKEFSSLSALVTHHSVMPELLPVPLRLPRAPIVRPDHDDLDNLTMQHQCPSSTRRPVPHAHTLNSSDSHPHTRTSSPRGTPPRSRHGTPHHMPSYLPQLDV